MPDDLTIRRLEPGDRAAWEPLFHSYIDFYQAFVADDVIDETWARQSDTRTYGHDIESAWLLGEGCLDDGFTNVLSLQHFIN